MERLQREEGAKLDNEVWHTHIDTAHPFSLHNVGALGLYPLKVVGEGFNVVNRAIPKFVPGYQNLLDKIASTVDQEHAERQARDAAAKQALEAQYQGAPPMPSSLTAHPPVTPAPRGPTWRERAREAAYQERYADPRASETYVQQLSRDMSLPGVRDLADPRFPTLGEDIGEATRLPVLGTMVDMAVPFGPVAGASKLVKGIRGAAEFLGSSGPRFSQAELMAMRAAELERGAQMTQQANAAARAGMGRLAEAERVQEVRKLMEGFQAKPKPPKLHIPEAAPAPPKLHIPEAAAEPNLLDQLTAPKLHIPEAAPEPIPDRLASPEYLASLKPKRGRKKGPAGQGDVFTGPTASSAPAPPRNLLDELTTPAPEPGPWKAPELPGPIKPELEYRPGQADLAQKSMPDQSIDAPAPAEVNPAQRMGQAFRNASQRLRITPEQISRRHGMNLAASEVEKVFQGTGTPDQVQMVSRALGFEMTPQGMRWTPPRGAKNVAGWDEQLELARAWGTVAPPDPLKVAPARAGAVAAHLRRQAERPRPASFFDEATAPGDLRAGPRSETFMPQDLQIDAKAYQFKEGGDVAGVTDRLRGVKTWDRAKSGKAIVHERLDGSRYIADGHQRLGLATRLTREGHPAALDALVYREADGYSVADVRRIAAAKNLAEGTGSAIDAAKVAREVGADHPDLASIPKTSATYRDGEQLAKLGDRSFEEVVNGAVKPEFAAHVGRLIQGDAAQLGALRALKRIAPKTSAEALSIVQDIRAQGLATRAEQGGLFGREDVMEDILAERAKIFSAAQGIAENDKSLFRAIVRGEGRFQEAGNVLAGEANRAQITDAERLLAGLEEAKFRGPVAKRLNELARELKAGNISERDAARAFLESVRSESEVAHAARPGAGGPALDAGGEREVIPDIEGQDSFFSMEQGTVRKRGREPREAPEQGRLFPKEPKKPPGPQAGEKMPAPYELAGQKVQLGKMEVARRLPMPALVKLSRSLTGQVPDVSKALKALSRKMGARINGRFSGGRVEIHPDLFRDEEMASKVLGHEIGHVLDLIGPEQGQVRALRSQLAAEMRKTPELYKEALALSKEWRPYDQAGATHQFLRYREAAEEVIADFLSAFLNDAEYAHKTAPRMTQAFYATLDKRPKVLRALTEVYDMMDGTLADFTGRLERELDLSFAKSEEIWKGLREEAAARKGSFWERMHQQVTYLFSDVGAEAKRRAQRLADGPGLRGAYDPRVMFDEGSYSANKRFLMARDWQAGVVDPLAKAGVEEAELGRYMFAQRIANGDRAALANPLGITAKNAAGILREMKGRAGFDAIEEAAKTARELYWKALEDAVDAGAISRKAFEEAKATRSSWAEFALVEDLHERMAGNLKGPAGTFQDVANPATASFMKAVATRNLAESNRARSGMIEFMQANFADELRRAKAGEVPKFGQREFHVLEDGERVTYHVDKWLSDMFDGNRFDELGQLARTLAILDHKLFKPLWITWNAGFQLMNVPRDAQRSTRAFSALGVTSSANPVNILRTLASYKGAAASAWRYAKGDLDHLLREMVEDYALAPPGESMTDLIAGETHMQSLLRQHGGIEAPRTRQGLAKMLAPVDQAVSFLLTAGRALEAVPKIAGYQRLGEAGITGAERAHLVRTYIGTPNFKIRGAATQISNSALIFSNIAIQGLKADLHLGTSPATRGAFWVETVKHGIMPKMLMAAGAYGLFGGEIKEMFDAIGEYDKTQFICLPVGWEEGGEHGKRVKFIRMPLDETTRFFAGLAWKAAHGPNSGKDLEDWAADTLKFSAGQLVPDLGPTMKIAGAVAQVAQGNNPDDDFTGRPIIREKEFEAGGAARWKGLLKWSVGQFGMAGEVARTYIDNSGTKPQTIWTPALLPGLNRFFRVSDRGFSEAQQQTRANQDKAKAKLKLGYGNQTREVYNTYFRLQKLGRKNRNATQERAYHRASSFYNGPYQHAQKHVQQLLDTGHDVEAARFQQRLERQAEPYYRELNKLTGRTER